MPYFSFLLILLYSAQSYAVNFEYKKFPTIKASLEGVNGQVTCNLDGEVNVYLCKHSGGDILLKKTEMDFVAIGLDSKGDPKSFPVKNLYDKTKPIYLTSDLSSYEHPSPALNEYLNSVASVENFFAEDDLSLKKPKGSPAYKSIEGRIKSRANVLKQKYTDAFNSSQYSVELEDGQKVSCQRSSTKKLTNEEQNYAQAMDISLQCGGFKCEPIVVGGKSYQATMFYNSSLPNLSEPNIFLTADNELGPSVAIKKIIAPQIDQPLVESFSPLKTNEYSNSMVQNLFPQGLGDDRAKIVYHKGPYVDQQVRFNQEFCTDKNYLAPLIEARKKLFKKVADLELQEFIQVLADGSLLGTYIDPAKAAEFGCAYNGLILDANAAKNLSKIKKDIYPDRNIEQTISMKKATELFNKAKNMKDIAWNYKLDGCYARAHLMARRFEAEGVRVDKVWIKGDLAVPEAGIRWNFHVAPIVYVDNGKGSITKMVIDPSLFNKPVTVEEWDQKMTKATVKGSSITAFPFPENAAFYERSALAFSSSDPYLPRDSIFMSEEDKMGMANMTMKEYKTLGPR